jgi:hypothetical protein
VRQISILFALLLSPLSTPAAQSPQPCPSGATADSVTPSRDGFFREVLFAQATSRTPRFDDYTEGSYHVNKLDLATGLPPLAERCGIQLRALLVVGPVGPLWTYHVFAFTRDSSEVVVTALVMPHARITGKAFRRLSAAEATTFLALLDSLSFIKPGQLSDVDDLEGDFRYDLIAAVYDKPTRFWSGSLPREESTEWTSFAQAIEALMREATTTYPLGN